MTNLLGTVHGKDQVRFELAFKSPQSLASSPCSLAAVRLLDRFRGRHDLLQVWCWEQHPCLVVPKGSFGPWTKISCDAQFKAVRYLIDNNFFHQYTFSIKLHSKPHPHTRATAAQPWDFSILRSAAGAGCLTCLYPIRSPRLRSSLYRPIKEKRGTSESQGNSSMDIGGQGLVAMASIHWKFRKRGHCRRHGLRNRFIYTYAAPKFENGSSFDLISLRAVAFLTRPLAYKWRRL